MEPELDEKFRALQDQLAQLNARLYRVERQLDSKAQFPEPVSPSSFQPAPAIAAQVSEVRVQPPVPRTPADEPRSTIQSRPSTAPLHKSLGRSRATSDTLESVIGGQWLNRLGVVAVLVGLSYFLKLAIDNNWIGPASRILIGLAAGIGLLFWSERFRRRGFAAFSYSLKALGFGALYLSLWAGFQLYHLVSAAVAFVAMVLVTLTAAAMSIVLDSELLAAFALVGGFLTPVLLSTNENREVSLLSYLLLLDVGAVWVVAAKRWIRLLPGALGSTLLLSAAWAFTYYSDSQLATTFLFATVFFLVFAAAQFLVTTLPEQRDRWAVLERVVIVLNAAGYFLALLGMMAVLHRHLLAFTTCALGVGCLLLGRMLLLKTSRSDLEITYLILALAFFTLAVPIQFDNRWITCVWGLEAALLLGFWRRTNRVVLRDAAAAVLALSIFRLVLLDSTREATLLFNPRFGLYLLTIAVTALLAYFSIRVKFTGWLAWAAAALVVFNALLLVALSLEVHDYFVPLLRSAASPFERRSVEIAEAFSYSALWMLYGAALMLVGFWKRQTLIRWLAIVLLAITAIKVFFVDVTLLQRGYRIASFIALGMILLAVSFFYQRARFSAERL